MALLVTINSRTYRKRPISRAQALDMGAGRVVPAKSASEPAARPVPTPASRSDGAQTTRTVNLPSKAVRFVIGKRGATLKGIEAATGVSVKIVGGKGSGNQRAVIKGANVDAVARAEGSVLAIVERSAHAAER